MNSTSIIIYEDNEFLRKSLKENLELSGDIKIIGEFDNCLEIEDQMKIFHPDVVLMDIGLPGRNGIEGLKLVRQHDPGIFVIMLTVFEDNDNIFEAICHGASGYLLKSTSTDKIVEAIKDLKSGGAPMTPSIARKVLYLFQKHTVPQEDQFGLSQREKEILNLLTTGYSYKMIANQCFISVETVRSHIKKIYDKLQVHSATEAAYKISRNPFQSS